VYHEETGRLVDVTIRTEGVTTLWPAKWDLRTLLMEMLASPRRSIWIREKLNDLHALAGKMFKRQWFHYEEPERLPRLVKTVQAWDTSYGEGKSNFSVCVTAALSADNKVYVLRVRRERLEFPELVRAMRSEYERMRPSRVVVEDKVSGRSAIQTLERETTIPLVRVSPGTQDKAARAEPVTPYYEAGRVVHVTGGDWLDTFEDELVMFPDGEFDDQVDALVYAVMDLVGNERGLEMGELEVWRG
jgi:predicted phage terminase large subunit-like protein